MKVAGQDIIVGRLGAGLMTILSVVSGWIKITGRFARQRAPAFFEFCTIAPADQMQSVVLSWKHFVKPCSVERHFVGVFCIVPNSQFDSLALLEKAAGST
ncbi:hypothetical protein A0U89_13950 (plasmid) [Kozakia baliensis]|uniref:Uncharacterized protein n=1 Tax=Kozakia baliensis TaxID=153496 RepID=A0A1D8UXI5_9PROT|nr:hypothetical protein A0U89_13950 [Kozakia baliensis]